MGRCAGEYAKLPDLGDTFSITKDRFDKGAIGLGEPFCTIDERICELSADPSSPINTDSNRIIFRQCQFSGHFSSNLWPLGLK